MKVLMLTADGVEDLELYYPYYRLKEEGFQVDVATPNGQPATCKHGYKTPADLAFADVDASAYGMLVIPGGRGPETVRLDEDALSITTEIFQAGKPVAAICHGAQVLISAGLVKHRRATCWPGVRDDLIAAGADYVDEEVVMDENLITSRMPDDLPAFCAKILEAVAATAPAR